MNTENNSDMELSTTPMSDADAVNAIMGTMDSQEQPIDQHETEETQVEAQAETEEEAVEEQIEEADGDIELSEDDYDHLIGIKQWADEQGYASLDDIKSAALMRSDYTQKTQVHAEEVKAFKEQSNAQLTKLAETLETAQALLYGQKQEFSPEAMRALKDNDPLAYEEKMDAYLAFTEKEKQINDLIGKVQIEYADQQKTQQAQYNQEQSELLRQYVPDLTNPEKAQGIIDSVNSYAESIGLSVEAVNGINDAVAMRVLIDAAKGAKAQQSVTQAKQPQKKPARRVVRSGSVSNKKAQQNTAAKMKKLAGLRGSAADDLAAELIMQNL